MRLIPGTNGEISVKIGRFLGKGPDFVQIEKLPYGEKYVRIPFDVDDRAAVVNTFFPNPDEILFESRLIGEILRERGAKELILVAPYLAYSRKRATVYGEAKSLETVMEILGVFDRILAVDFYGSSEIVENVSAIPLLAEYTAEEFDLTNPVVLGPDELSIGWLDPFAEIMQAEVSLIRKIRVDAENVVVSRIDADVRGRDVVIVDDIVATGATVVQSAKKLKGMGARRIFVVASHALLSKEVYASILKSGVEEVISTDTVLSPVSRVSVSKLIADELM
ncbi:ribose-phosphate diphosphokinase [Geoglobus sp.]